MAHNEFQGNVIGEVWRAQESDTEIVYFVAEGEDNWFRTEFNGPAMLERAEFLAQKLKTAAGSGSNIEVGVDYDELTTGETPTTFNLVRYIQIRA